MDFNQLANYASTKDLIFLSLFSFFLLSAVAWLFIFNKILMNNIINRLKNIGVNIEKQNAKINAFSKIESNLNAIIEKEIQSFDYFKEKAQEIMQEIEKIETNLEKIRESCKHDLYNSKAIDESIKKLQNDINEISNITKELKEQKVIYENQLKDLNDKLNKFIMDSFTKVINMFDFKNIPKE